MPTAKPRSRAVFSSRASARSISPRGRHGVERQIRLGEGQVAGAGDLARQAARRAAVLHIDQSALGGLAQHRRERCIRCREAAPHVVGDAHIALHAAHQPMQPLEVLVGIERCQQGLRPRIVVRIVEGLHRHLQQHLVPAVARPRRQTLEIGPVGREPEGHRARKLGERIAGAERADPEPGHHDGDPRRVRPIRHRLDGLREGIGRAGAVRGDPRDRAALGSLHEALVGDRLAGAFVGALARDHHLLALAVAAVDDGDHVGGGGRRAGRRAVAGRRAIVAVGPRAVGLGRRVRLRLDGFAAPQRLR